MSRVVSCCNIYTQKTIKARKIVVPLLTFKELKYKIMDKEKLKLFVWRDVLCDYTCGMVCILAYSEEEAIMLAKEELEDYEWKDLHKKPVIVDKPTVFSVWGGG